MSVLFACTLPATAMRMSVTQCIPAPVSPNQLALALIGMAPAGNDCIAVEYTCCATRSSLTLAKRSATAASP
eukprot:4875953-Pleurochrysis_carterae.AAC.1